MVIRDNYIMRNKCKWRNYGNWEFSHYWYGNMSIIIWLCMHILSMCENHATLLAIPEVSALGQSYLDGTFMGDIDLYPRR